MGFAWATYVSVSEDFSEGASLQRKVRESVIWQIFSRKLHENERNWRNWIERGGCVSPLDPPVTTDFELHFTFVITNGNLIIWVDCLLRLSYQRSFFRIIWITDDSVYHKMLAAKLKGNHGEMWWQINQ